MAATRSDARAKIRIEVGHMELRHPHVGDLHGRRHAVSGLESRESLQESHGGKPFGGIQFSRFRGLDIP